MQFYRERKKKESKTRRLPLLPRVGVYVDWAGYETIFKFAPLLEALVQLPERGMSVYQLVKLSKEQLEEIKFPARKKAKTIDTTARTVSVKQKLRK